jgi:1-acyl-sn-glycerol-3-phosphate acyltransferase
MMAIVRAAWDYLLLALGVLLFIVEALVWGPVALVLGAVLQPEAARRLGRQGITAVFRLYLAAMEMLGAWRLDLRELDTLRDAGPLIIAPNHPCLLDAVLIVSRLPNAVCVMKRALLGNILLGPGARLARYVPNDSLLRLMSSAGDELRQGGQLLLFPEGTRTLGDPIGPLTEAVGALSRHARVPVQTVIIETDTPFLGKGRSILARPGLPLAFRVRLGKRFDPPEDVRAFTTELERYFTRELSDRGAPVSMPQRGGAAVGSATNLRG